MMSLPVMDSTTPPDSTPPPTAPPRPPPPWSTSGQYAPYSFLVCIVWQLNFLYNHEYFSQSIFLSCAAFLERSDYFWRMIQKTSLCSDQPVCMLVMPRFIVLTIHLFCYCSILKLCIFQMIEDNKRDFIYYWNVFFKTCERGAMLLYLEKQKFNCTD